MRQTDRRVASHITAESTYAAIDLGSNSFHMVVANAGDSHPQMIDKLRRPVRLGAGLDKHNNLTRETIEQAVECLSLFQHRLRGVPTSNIRAVGTNTLRRARNAEEFGELAEQTLGVPIDIISGREEARLIFAGVTYGCRDDLARLVVDIGGGSTELICGTGTSPSLMESTNIGCVSAHHRFFANAEPRSGKKFARIWEGAIEAAQLEMQSIQSQYHEHGWNRCIGSSGTIKAAERILIELGYSDHGIAREDLEDVGRQLAADGLSVLDKVKQVSNDRRAVMAGGLAVLLAVFRSFDVDIMHVSHSALREGLIIDLAAGEGGSPVRDRAIEDLQRRFQIDAEQVSRVSKTALHFHSAVKQAWQLDAKRDISALSWAASLHEIGLSVAHVQYHKHGDYLLRNADMLGFTRGDQALIASLVRNHRRKIDRASQDTVAHYDQQRYPLLLVILRLAVLFHRLRNSSETPPVQIDTGKDRLRLTFPGGWLDQHPLTNIELEEEIAVCARLGVTLSIDASS